MASVVELMGTMCALAAAMPLLEQVLMVLLRVG